MIDTHAHVHSSAFDHDRDAVLERAFVAGVDCLLEVNIDGRRLGERRRSASERRSGGRRVGGGGGGGGGGRAVDRH